MNPTQTIAIDAELVKALRRLTERSGRTISEEIRVLMAARSDDAPAAQAAAINGLLRTREAAEFLGYRPASHRDPTRAFLQFARRNRIARAASGRLRLWRVADLEAALTRVDGDSYVV